MAELAPRHLEILQHALGVDRYGRGARTRNHFCAGADDEQLCRELVEMGYAKQFERTWLPYFNITITDEGAKVMLAASSTPPKRTRSQLRYERFLAADSGLSFREWLRYDAAQSPEVG